MAGSVFREKSLKRISSPEEMDHYIKILNPSVWIVLSAIIILLACFIIWGIFGKVETKVSATGIVENGYMNISIPQDVSNANKIKSDMIVLLDEEEVGKVSNINLNQNGQYNVTITTVNLADGKYDLDILIEKINLMYFIFN